MGIHHKCDWFRGKKELQTAMLLMSFFSIEFYLPKYVNFNSYVERIYLAVKYWLSLSGATQQFKQKIFAMLKNTKKSEKMNSIHKYQNTWNICDNFKLKKR